jgi:hypothetical protein
MWIKGAFLLTMAPDGGLSAGDGRLGLDEARPLGGKPRTHMLDQHAANLGAGGGESNRPLH